MKTGMNLEWRKCQTGNIIAPLPDIPGYPIGGPFHFFSHLVTLLHPGWDRKNIKDVWTFDISLHLKTGGTAVLTNDDMNIPGTERVEDIAAKFLEKGYQPVAE